jgi:UDP-3-O-[3-hydroxymyristoyl] glucosamine N-acyltransferase
VKLRDLAERLDCRLEGDGDVDIRRVAGIQTAESGDVTFLANPKYEKALRTTRASAVILKDDAPAAPCAMLRAKDPYLAFARAVGLFAPVSRPAPGVHLLASVAADTQIGADVSLGAFVAIGEGVTIGDRTIVYPNVTVGPGSRIGSDCVIHSNVSIRERVTLGDRVVLQNGVVIGGDGYGFVRRGDGTHEKIPQIDNLVQIGHGVTIGRNVLLAAQVGIAGSTDVQDDVVFGGQVGVGGHLTIGRGAVAVGQSGVTNSLDPRAMVAGYPAIDSRDWRKASVLFKRLPELKRRIEALETRIARFLSSGAESKPERSPE